MKDLTLIVRYCGQVALPDLDTPKIALIGETPPSEHIVRIVLGFHGDPPHTIEYRESARTLALLYPDNPENQVAIAIAQAIRAAATHFEGSVITNQKERPHG